MKVLRLLQGMILLLLVASFAASGFGQSAKAGKTSSIPPVVVNFVDGKYVSANDNADGHTLTSADWKQQQNWDESLVLLDMIEYPEYRIESPSDLVEYSRGESLIGPKTWGLQDRAHLNDGAYSIPALQNSFSLNSVAEFGVQVPGQFSLNQGRIAGQIDGLGLRSTGLEALASSIISADRSGKSLPNAIQGVLSAFSQTPAHFGKVGGEAYGATAQAGWGAVIGTAIQVVGDLFKPTKCTKFGYDSESKSEGNDQKSEKTRFNFETYLCEKGPSQTKDEEEKKPEKEEKPEEDKNPEQEKKDEQKKEEEEKQPEPPPEKEDGGCPIGPDEDFNRRGPITVDPDVDWPIEVVLWDGSYGDPFPTCPEWRPRRPIAVDPFQADYSPLVFKAGVEHGSLRGLGCGSGGRSGGGLGGGFGGGGGGF